MRLFSCRRAALAVAAAALAGLALPAAQAQAPHSASTSADIDWPQQPVTIIMTFSAGSGVDDHAGAFVVTIHGTEELASAARADHDDYRAILVQAIGDRLVEAAAEYVHRLVRTEAWGYAPDEALGADDLIRETYAGIRPAPGYPACPEHTEKRTIWDLLDVQATAGIELTEGMAMWPGAAVSGLYFAHPESRYFLVGRIGRDQVEDYARRKGWTLTEAERWLSPNLGYRTQDE